MAAAGADLQGLFVSLVQSRLDVSNEWGILADELPTRKE
jgi:hypothetical protein